MKSWTVVIMMAFKKTGTSSNTIKLLNWNDIDEQIFFNSGGFESFFHVIFLQWYDFIRVRTLIFIIIHSTAEIQSWEKFWCTYKWAFTIFIKMLMRFWWECTPLIKSTQQIQVRRYFYMWRTDWCWLVLLDDSSTGFIWRQEFCLGPVTYLNSISIILH
jgi:hypothetical protein